MHILSAEQFSTAQLGQIFSRADDFKKHSKNLSDKKKLAGRHSGRQLATLFFQPSTRTRVSFEAAAVKLGMGLVSTENARDHSSSAKGESLEDTIRTVNGYGFDVIVMRHYEVGAAARAAAVSKTPIINAGDGTGEHPTQAVLDAYTIFKNKARLSDLKVVIGGDLQNGRTVRSLSLLLSKYPKNQISFVSIQKLQVGDDVKKLLDKSRTTYSESSDIKSALKDADVIYWTRLQAEYLKGSAIPKDGFSLNKKLLANAKKDAIIMHPLPRVDEIHPEVDADPRAKYFEQAANGLYVRMALLDMILNGDL